MNEIINKFLLTGDNFIPALYLRQLRFTYSACGPFTKHCKRIKKFKETGDLNYIFKNELQISFFCNSKDANSKDLAKRTVSNKVLKDIAYEIAIIPKYNGYQRGLTSIVYNIFDKKIG